MLTSEIPFLDKYQDMDGSVTFISGLDIGSPDESTAISATMDMALLLDYCRNLKPFPTESLQNHGVSTDGISFVRSLMAPKPSDRVSAADALKSTWFTWLGARSPTPPTPPTIVTP